MKSAEPHPTPKNFGSTFSTTMHRLILIFSVVVIGLLINITSQFSTDWKNEFDYYTYLDEDELFRLYWNNLGNDIVEFGMEAQANGWIAIGMLPSHLAYYIFKSDNDINYTSSSLYTVITLCT